MSPRLLILVVVLANICLNSFCAAKEISMSADDDYESEIDKIYKKHNKLDEIAQFDAFYLNAIKTHQGDIDRLLKDANTHEVQGQDIQACALYLAVTRIMFGNSDKAKLILDSSRKAMRIALRHDSRVQRKLMEVLRKGTHFYDTSSESLQIQDYFLTDLLQVAKALADKSIVLELSSELARVKRSQKKFNESIALYKDCIELAPQLDNYHTGASSKYLDSLLAIYNEQGNSIAASAMIKERIASAEQNPEAQLPLAKLTELQELYLQDGKIEKAADALKKTVAELEKKLNKPVNKNDPFQRSDMYQLGATVDASLRFVKKLEEKGLQINDIHEKLLRMQYQAGKSSNDSWFSSKLGALTSFLLKNGKAAEAAAILKIELVDQKGKLHFHHYAQLESNYLSALKAANMTDEYNKIISEKAEEHKKQADEQARALESRLEISRSQLKNDPNSFIQLATAVISQHSSSRNNLQNAAQLRKDVLDVYKNVSKDKLNASSLNCIWTISHLLPETSEKNSHAPEMHRLERELVESHEKLVAQTKKDGEYHSSNDLTEQVYIYSARASLETRVDFINYVIDLRRKYNPNNKERIQTAFEWLAKAYCESGNTQKEKEAREQLLAFLNSCKPIDKSLILKEEIEIAILSHTKKNTEQTLAKLESFLPEVAKCDQRSQSILTSRILGGFCSIAMSFADNNELSKAQDILRLTNESAKKIKFVLPVYEQNQVLDKITSALLAKSDFLGAERNLELKIELIESSQQSDDHTKIELGDTLVRLSEATLLHSRTLADHSEMQKLAEKSAVHLRKALEVYDKCKSDYAPWSKGWALRRHEYLKRSGKNPDDFHKYEPLNVKVRYHLEDVPNQAHGQAPQPFECAVLARSRADVGAACATALSDSSVEIVNTQRNESPASRQPALTVAGRSNASSGSGHSEFSRRLSGPEVLSTGATLLNGTAKVPATVGGRSIVMTGGGNIRVLGNLDASGDIPDAFPWTAALTPPLSAQIIPGLVADGKVEASPDRAVVDLGEFSLASGEKLKMGVGDYLVSRLILSPGSSIEIDGSAEANKSVRFFVRDIKSKYSDAPQILIEGAAINQSGIPAEMQFWCSGEGLVVIKGSKINSIIYAPNAPLIISASQLVGALAADEVRLRNGTRITYDVATPSAEKLGLSLLEVPGPVDTNKIEAGGGGSISCTGARADEDYQARKYIELGEYKDAIRSYSDALKKQATAQNYVGRAYSYFRTEEYDHAMADCKIAIGDEPDYALAHAICGIIYDKLGKAQEAKSEFLKAIELCPIDEDMDDLLFLSICQNGIENSDQAIEILSEAISAMKSDAELYMFRADIHDKVGQTELASKDRATVEELRKKQRERRQQENEAFERAKEWGRIVNP